MRGILFSFLIIFPLSIFSQVSNDDCSGALFLGNSLGGIGPPINCYVNPPSTTPGNVYFVGDNNSAVPNFPYPNINTAVSCNGYRSTVAIGGKDVWYRAQSTNNTMYFRVEAIDTVHLSLWYSNMNGGCAALYPKRCYTLLPGTFITDAVPACLRDIYFQFSGANSIDSTSFSLCYGGSTLLCSFSYANSTPTPVHCFDYNVSITHPLTSSSNDGIILVNVTNGNNPYFYSWNDGDSTSSRSGLSEGTYVVTITDSLGCLMIDTMVLTSQVTTTETMIENTQFVRIYPNPARNNIKIENLHGGDYDISIYNNYGMLFKNLEVESDETIISISNMPAGIYWILLKGSNGSLHRQKMVKI